MSVEFPYPVLVSDIGGTNARFALVEAAGAPLSAVIRLPTAGHASFAAAADAAVAAGGWPRPRSLLAGAAGAVTDRQVTLTNADWTINGPDVAAALGLDQGLLLNDFETLALSVPAFTDAHLLTIGPDLPPAPGARVVIGPGTGLGVGALAEIEGRFLPLASEGGHIGFPAESEYEQLIWSHLGYSIDPPEAETLLAGPGLPAFYQAVARAQTIWPGELTPAEIVTRALAKSDPIAVDTVDRLLDHIARFCSDMALTFLATGGVYLAGGILPRLRPLIDPKDFRLMFERNETHSDLLSTIPTRLIIAEEPALIGLAALAANPARYMLDYRRRLWR